MRKINKNEVYVLHQPKFATASIIIVPNKFPLTSEIQDTIDKLVEFTDVFFVFSDQFKYKSYFNKFKFSTLHNVCGFIDTDTSMPETLIKLLEYCLEIFKKHAAFNIFNDIFTENIKIEETVYKNITNLSMQDNKNPIFEYKRLDTNELWEKYEKEEELIETKEDNSTNNIFRLRKNLNTNNKGAIDFNAYSTYKSTSNLMYVKTGSIMKLVEYVNNRKEVDTPDNYFDIRSFNNHDNFSLLIPSFYKYINEDIINSDISNINFNINKE